MPEKDLSYEAYLRSLKSTSSEGFADKYLIGHATPLGREVADSARAGGIMAGARTWGRGLFNEVRDSLSGGDEDDLSYEAYLESRKQPDFSDVTDGQPKGRVVVGKVEPVLGPRGRTVIPRSTMTDLATGGGGLAPAIQARLELARDPYGFEDIRGDINKKAAPGLASTLVDIGLGHSLDLISGKLGQGAEQASIERYAEGEGADPAAHKTAFRVASDVGQFLGPIPLLSPVGLGATTAARMAKLFRTMPVEGAVKEGASAALKAAMKMKEVFPSRAAKAADALRTIATDLAPAAGRVGRNAVRTGLDLGSKVAGAAGIGDIVLGPEDDESGVAAAARRTAERFGMGAAGGAVLGGAFGAIGEGLGLRAGRRIVRDRLGLRVDARGPTFGEILAEGKVARAPWAESVPTEGAPVPAPPEVMPATARLVAKTQERRAATEAQQEVAIVEQALQEATAKALADQVSRLPRPSTPSTALATSDQLSADIQRRMAAAPSTEQRGEVQRPSEPSSDEAFLDARDRAERVLVALEELRTEVDEHGEGPDHRRRFAQIKQAYNEALSGLTHEEARAIHAELMGEDLNTDPRLDTWLDQRVKATESQREREKNADTPGARADRQYDQHRAEAIESWRGRNLVEGDKVEDIHGRVWDVSRQKTKGTPGAPDSEGGLWQLTRVDEKDGIRQKVGFGQGFDYGSYKALGPAPKKAIEPGPAPTLERQPVTPRLGAPTPAVATPGSVTGRASDNSVRNRPVSVTVKNGAVTAKLKIGKAAFRTMQFPLSEWPANAHDQNQFLLDRFAKAEGMESWEVESETSRHVEAVGRALSKVLSSQPAGPTPVAAAPSAPAKEEWWEGELPDELERRVAKEAAAAKQTPLKRGELAASARTEKGALRPLYRVTDEGLFGELTALSDRMQEASGRAIYRTVESQGATDTAFKMIQASTRSKGGGPSMQSKALQNLKDMRGLWDKIESELKTRGHTDDTIADGLLGAGEDQATRDERGGMQIGERLARAYGSRRKAYDAAQTVLELSGSMADTPIGPPRYGMDRLENMKFARQASTAWVDIRGQKITKSEDYQRLLAPFRSPAMEKFHVIITADDGTILSHTLETSGALNYVAFEKLPAWAERIVARATRLKATKIHFAHNHPSGDATPSGDDKNFTKVLGLQLQQRGLKLVGHYIIDHTKGTFLYTGETVLHPAVSGVESRSVDFGDAKAPDWTWATGAPIKGPEDVMKLVRDGNKPGQPAVLFVDAQHHAIALEPHKPRALDRIEKWLPARLKAHGAMSAVVITERHQAHRVAQKTAGWNPTVDSIIEVIVDYGDGVHFETLAGQGLIGVYHKQGKPDRLKRLREPEPEAPFPSFSPLRRAIENAPFEKGTADQWWAIVRKGVSKNELEATGVDKFIMDRTGKSITRAEILEHATGNRVRLEETVRSAATGREEHDVLEWPEKTLKRGEHMTSRGGWAQIHMLEGNGRYLLTEPGVGMDLSFDTIEEAKRNAQRSHAARTRRTEGYPSFPDHVIPGGENYREILIQTPAEKFDPSKVTIEREKSSTTQGTAVLSYDGTALGTFDDPQRLNLETGKYEGKTDQQYIEIVRKRFDGLPAMRMPALGAGFRGSHWKEPNVLAHVRLTERKTPDGESVLFIEEVQSDWHQQGRKRGYGTQPIDQEAIAKLREKRDYAAERYREFLNGPDTKENLESRAAWGRQADDMVDAIRDLERPRVGPPDAPYKKTDEWTELSLKRALTEAVNTGADFLSWTTGEQQAAINDLSQHVDRIIYDPDSGYLRAFYNGVELVEQHYPVEELPAAIGKGAAAKLLESNREEVGDGLYHVIEGDDLHFGGEGMKHYYDVILPKALFSIGKKLGVKISLEPVDMGDPAKVGEIEAEGDEHGFDPDVADAAADARRAVMQNPGVRITPELAAAVKKGMAIAEPGAKYESAGGDLFGEPTGPDQGGLFGAEGEGKQQPSSSSSFSVKQTEARTQADFLRKQLRRVTDPKARQRIAKQLADLERIAGFDEKISAEELSTRAAAEPERPINRFLESEEGALKVPRVSAPIPPQYKASFDAVAQGIDFTGSIAKGAKKGAPGLSNRIQKFADALSNQVGAIERLGEIARREPGSRPHRNPQDLLSYAKTSDEVYRRALHDGVMDPVTRKIVGPSFRSIFEPVQGDDEATKAALTYIVAKRNVGRGISSVLGNVKKFREMEEVVRYGDKTPELREVAKRWGDFVDALGNYAVGSGMWTPELWKSLKDSDILYVRFRRIMDDAVNQKRGMRTKTLGNVGPGVDRFEGSLRAISNPAEAMAEYAQRIFHRSDRYRVGHAIFDAIEDMGPAGQLIGSRIPEDSPMAKAVSVAALRAAAQGLAPKNVLDEVERLFDPKLSRLNPVLWRNRPEGGGKKEFLQIHAPELWTAIMQLNANDESAVRKFLDITIRPLKRLFTATTTGWSPRFSLATNPARDIPDALMKTQVGMTPADIAAGYAQAIANVAGKSATAEEAGRFGLTGVSMFAQDRPKAAARQAAPLTARDRWMNRAGRAVTLPVKALETAGEASDLGPRLGEYRAALRRFQGKVDRGEWTIEEARLRAATLGRPITLDFSNRPGNPVLKLFADYIPFFGVGLQGPVRYGQAWARNPSRTAAATVLAAMAAAAAWELKQQMRPEDRQRIDDRATTERSGYLFVPTPQGAILKVPLGQEQGLIVQGVTAALDKLINDDPNAGALMRSAIARAIPSGMDAMSQGVVPLPGIQQIQENIANKKVFQGRPVEAKRMERDLPEERRYDTTPATFDLMATGSRAIGFGPMDSPLKAENVVRGVTSSATPLITGATDPVARRIMGREAKKSVPRGAIRQPLNPASALVAAEPPGGTQSEAVYYDVKEKLEQVLSKKRSVLAAKDTAGARALLKEYRPLLKPEVRQLVGEVDKRLLALRDSTSELRFRFQSGKIKADAAHRKMDDIVTRRQTLLRRAVKILRRQGVSP